MKHLKIHIVEDDKWYSELLKYHLELNPDYEVKCFENGKSFKKSILKENPDVVCLDFSIPDYSGEELLKFINSKCPETEVIIISGQEDVITAVNLLKNGAYDYLVKNENTTELLWNSILKILENKSLKKEVKQLRKEVNKKYIQNDSFIGESLEMKKVFALIDKAAQTDITVSVNGETGTGKELVSKAIHYKSGKKNQTFVAVNVAAIPKELIESELFGFEKGSFTGANSRRIGKFEEANGGTLFLDEIGEMDPNMQSKLLRALQEREITRIGGDKKIKVNFRVIVATHKNLLEEVQKGNFRQDLYYRLLGLPIELPALRDRKSDIKLLANEFLRKFSQSNFLGQKTLDKSAIKKLTEYPFPGNIRELKALIELAAVMCDSEIITEKDISFRATGGSLSDLMIEELSLEDYKIKIINHFLEKYNNNVLKVASKLDIGKSTIYRIINKI